MSIEILKRTISNLRSIEYQLNETKEALETELGFERKKKYIFDWTGKHKRKDVVGKWTGEYMKDSDGVCFDIVSCENIRKKGK